MSIRDQRGRKSDRLLRDLVAAENRRLVAQAEAEIERAARAKRNELMNAALRDQLAQQASDRNDRSNERGAR